MERLLTSAEVADMLAVSQATLSRWRGVKAGPRVVKMSGLFRYRPEDVERWVEGNLS